MTKKEILLTSATSVHALWIFSFSNRLKSSHVTMNIHWTGQRVVSFEVCMQVGTWPGKALKITHSFHPWPQAMEIFTLIVWLTCQARLLSFSDNVSVPKQGNKQPALIIVQDSQTWPGVLSCFFPQILQAELRRTNFRCTESPRGRRNVHSSKTKSQLLTSFHVVLITGSIHGL